MIRLEIEYENGTTESLQPDSLLVASSLIFDRRDTPGTFKITMTKELLPADRLQRIAKIIEERITSLSDEVLKIYALATGHEENWRRP